MQTIYIVTGGSGFLGSTVIRALHERKDRVRALVRSQTKAAEALSGLDVELVYGDIANKPDIERLFSDTDECEYIVIHAAAIIDIGSRKAGAEITKVNIDGTKNVVDVCAGKSNVRRLVYVSSVHAIPEKPKREVMTEITEFNADEVIGGYAKTKCIASKYVMEACKNGLDAIIVHPSGITGPGDYGGTYLTQLVLDYNNGKIPAGVKGGYDFVDVRDVAAGILSAVEKGSSGDCFLLTNEYTSVKDILNILYNLLKKKRIKTMFPIWTARIALPFTVLYAKLLKKRPLYTSYSLYTLKSNSNFSHEKADRILTYNPRKMEESLADTVEFLRQAGKL